MKEKRTIFRPFFVAFKGRKKVNFSKNQKSLDLYKLYDIINVILEVHKMAKDFEEMLDEEYEDDIITLTTADGEEVDFVEIAGIAHDGKFYAILQPVELLDGMDDDEALVFEVVRNADGSDGFNVVLDDEIIDAVFAEYNRLLEEAEA